MNAFLLVLIVAAACFRFLLFLPQTDVRGSIAPLWRTEGTLVSVTRTDDGVVVLTRAEGTEVPLADVSCQLFVWDPAAPVYVSAGLDGKPGVANVDDEGNAVIDDPSELGATGSDDVMLTPDHPDHAAAASGEVTSRLLSRGAMRLLTSPQSIHGPAQIRIDALQEQRLVSKILDLVPGSQMASEQDGS